MAKAIRQIVDTARRAFNHRRTDPFFELQIVKDMKPRPQSPLRDAIRHYAPCAVLQRRYGHEDDLQRDLMVSFLPPPDDPGGDPENGLRIVHSTFDFIGQHRRQGGFARTQDLEHSPCPFYTCCNLALRTQEPGICRDSPWKSVDWSKWDEAKGACWYATAIRITRPPR